MQKAQSLHKKTSAEDRCQRIIPKKLPAIFINQNYLIKTQQYAIFTLVEFYVLISHSLSPPQLVLSLVILLIQRKDPL